MLHQPQQTAPVKIETIDAVGRFVGAAKTKKVRCDDSMTRARKHPQHLAVQVGPGGFSMEA